MAGDQLHTELNSSHGEMLRVGEFVNHWRITRLLSGGGFGQVFVGVDSFSNQVAVKVESINASVHLLENEWRTMQLLSLLPNSYVPRIFSYGVTDSVRFMVMELAGKNMRELRLLNRDDRFSVHTSLWLLRDMVRAVEWMHSAGYIHRDLKPPNMCIAHTFPLRIVLIDFGLCRRFIDERGEMKVRKEKSSFLGTLRYSSMGALAGQDVCRWDDLWSLFYVTCENMLGTLPWRHVNNKEEVLQMKRNTNLLDAGLWKSVVECVPYCVSCILSCLCEAESSPSSFYTAPPYEWLRSVVDCELASLGWIEGSSLLDWMLPLPTPAGDIPAPQSFYLC